MARILIADPSPEIRELYGRVAARLGHEPLHEPNGAAPDLLLVEPGSPRGLTLARRLRDEHPRLPIVCASIYPRSSEAAALAPAAYLLKPFSIHELERTLERALAEVAAAR